jgi:hypothetical protein
VIKIEECHERSIMACLKLLLNEKLGLSALYPNSSIHLMSTAAVLPLEYSRSRKGIFTTPPSSNNKTLNAVGDKNLL